MVNSIISAFQLFGVGLTLGLSSQCFFVCAPLILSYVTAVEVDWKKALGDVALLAAGRLLAYVVLGALVSLSAGYIEKISASVTVTILKFVAGGIIILLGLLVAFGTGSLEDACGRLRQSALPRGGLFLAGLTIGLVPCLPLVSVMLEIAIISKSALSGAVYAFFFGLGTVLATLITVGPLAGFLGHVPSRTLKSAKVRAAFKMACGMLLVLFGIIFMRSPKL
jgi:sulfite exporter TauE/SafE